MRSGTVISLLITLTIMVVLTSGCSGNPVDNGVDPALIKILVPNGGEVWMTGTSRVISWSSENLTGNVNLEYSTDNFNVDINLIIGNVANDGEYTWENIPYDQSDNVRIRIISASNPAVFDSSDAGFTIQAQTLSVISPNGGEVWDPLTSQEIRWNPASVPGNVKIDFSGDNFVDDIQLIAENEPNDGSHIWQNIPNISTNSARVRVASYYDPANFDISDGDFALAGPLKSITVQFPKEGASWASGTDETITWASEGVTENVYIQYSTDNFISQIVNLAVDEPNDGAFYWKDISVGPSGTGKIKIGSTLEPSVFGKSEGTFSVIPNSKIFDWTIETLHTSGSDGRSIDLALHPDTEYPFITGCGYTTAPAAMTFVWNGSSWDFEHHWQMHPENGSGAAFYSSEKWPSLVFARNPDMWDDVWFYYQDPSGWQHVDHVADETPTGISSASDPSNDYSVWVASRWPTVRYYHHTTVDSWSHQVIDSAGGFNSDCWISENGEHFIAYDRYDIGDVALAYGVPPDFTVEIINDPVSPICGERVGVSGYTNGDTTIAGVVYRDKTNGSLRYAEFDGTDWSFSTVAQALCPGEFCSIDFDSDGNRYVAYNLEYRGDLWMAWSPDGITWQHYVVDDSDDFTGRWCVIKVTGDGRPRIAYADISPEMKTMFAWGE